MTRSNRFVRPGLAATENGDARPDWLVDEWLHGLGDLLDGLISCSEHHEAYDLLAMHGRFVRVASGVLEKAGCGELLDRLDKQIATGAEDLLRLALQVPNPPAWIEQAEELDRESDDLVDLHEFPRRVERLLVDLDDAELVAAQARRLGQGDERLEQGLSHCRDWLTANPDIFNCAAVYIQALGLAVEPTLEQENPFFPTLDKFLILLDELEDAQAAASLETVKPLNELECEALGELSRERRKWLDAFESEMEPVGLAADYRTEMLRTIESALALSAKSDEEDAGIRLLEWVAPSGEYAAVLPFPSKAQKGGTPMRVGVFFNTGPQKDKPATTLIGKTVRLGGQSSPLTAEVYAEFVLEDVAEQAGPVLTLEIDEEIWEPTRTGRG